MNQCPICYEEEENEEFVKLECNPKCKNNKYHKKCIEPWFRIKKDNLRCPCCFQKVKYDIKHNIYKWAIRSYTREQVHIILNTEFRKISYGYFYYPFMFVMYILGGYHKELEYHHIPMASLYLFVLERTNRLSQFIMDVTFFHYIGFHILFMILCKSNSDTSDWIFYEILDLGIFIYTFIRLEKLWHHYQFEQPSYILLENIHPSVLSIIQDQQWVD